MTINMVSMMLDSCFVGLSTVIRSRRELVPASSATWWTQTTNISQQYHQECIIKVGTVEGVVGYSSPHSVAFKTFFFLRTCNVDPSGVLDKIACKLAGGCILLKVS